MTPVEFLRDYLSKWGPEMDPDEYDGISRCIEALQGIATAVDAEREACAKVADEHARSVDFSWPENNLQLIAGEEIAINIRARGSK